MQKLSEEKKKKFEAQGERRECEGESGSRVSEDRITSLFRGDRDSTMEPGARGKKNINDEKKGGAGRTGRKWLTRFLRNRESKERACFYAVLVFAKKCMWSPEKISAGTLLPHRRNYRPREKREGFSHRQRMLKTPKPGANRHRENRSIGNFTYKRRRLGEKVKRHPEKGKRVVQGRIGKKDERKNLAEAEKEDVPSAAGPKPSGGGGGDEKSHRMTATTWQHSSERTCVKRSGTVTLPSHAERRGESK